MNRTVHPAVAEAVDQIDAAVFSGDSFVDISNAIVLQQNIERWKRKLAEHMEVVIESLNEDKPNPAFCAEGLLENVKSGDTLLVYNYGATPEESGYHICVADLVTLISVSVESDSLTSAWYFDKISGKNVLNSHLYVVDMYRPSYEFTIQANKR